MKELAKRFIDKECLISSFDSNHQFEGVIKEVSDSAILVEKNGTVEAINLDYVIRIREYPKNKRTGVIQPRSLPIFRNKHFV